VVAIHAVCWPRREVARSQKMTINLWCGGRTWGVIWREVARSRKTQQSIGGGVGRMWGVIAMAEVATINQQWK